MIVPYVIGQAEKLRFSRTSSIWIQMSPLLDKNPEEHFRFCKIPCRDGPIDVVEVVTVLVYVTKPNAYCRVVQHDMNKNIAALIVALVMAEIW